MALESEAKPSQNGEGQDFEPYRLDSEVTARSVSRVWGVHEAQAEDQTSR